MSISERPLGRFYSDAALSVALALALALPAQSELSVDEVRTQTRGLLQSMCSNRCDVVDVKIEMRREAPLGGVAPGFDDAPRARQVPSRVELTLLFDAKLDKPYRDFVAERVKQRISEAGLPVLVTQNVRAFPAGPPPEPAPESVAPAAPPPPAPAPIVVQPHPPAPLPPPAALPPEPPLLDVLWRKLFEAIPLLLMFGLLAWLVLRVLGRLEGLAFGRSYPEEDHLTVTPEVIEDSRAPMPISSAIPPPRPEDLIQDLKHHRGSTRRIFRRLLARSEHDTVARAVALLGDFVVQDLTHDPAVRRALEAAGARTSEVLRSPMTDEARIELLRIVQAELVADRVAHRSDDVRAELEILLGWGPEAFAAMLGKLDRRLQVVLLRHAPGHLTESYLRGLSADARTKVVRRLLEDPAAEPDEIEVLADTLETQAQAALVGGYEADHIVDLLDALPAEEQDSVVSDLETTRPDFVRRNLGQLPVESALLRVSDHALGVAWAQVPFEDWLQYLRAAPEAIRARAMAACPARLREALTDELGLRVAADPVRAVAARRKIVHAAQRAGAITEGAGATLVPSVVEEGDGSQPVAALPSGGPKKRRPASGDHT